MEVSDNRHYKSRNFDAQVSDNRQRYKYFVVGILLIDCCLTHLCEMSDDVGFYQRISGSNPVVTITSFHTRLRAPHFSHANIHK